MKRHVDDVPELVNGFTLRQYRVIGWPVNITLEGWVQSGDAPERVQRRMQNRS